ncbi:FG-GAP-like repeat-containing protein [Marinoscillum furvescens]|uniref:Putative secreted protein (Por secretion system target) n=1 Tax=Marinoscillum furvescens DSM 4134 TaxID=1122208 RepID=A0A3D9KZ73_MARFU|nr:FG-GAP-like repeat-containing protein [Marinoscillum furvescens]RED95589.1 putative secreted protein (Por secretion system target) [Marinoscillum furvescens DSM 4134]
MKHAFTIFWLLTAMTVWGQKFTPDWTLGLGAGVVTTDMVLDKAGNTYLTGYFTGASADFSLGAGVANIKSNAGGQDAFLARYDAAGGLDWVHAFGSSSNERFNALVLTHSGNLLLTGFLGSSTSGFDLDPGSGTVTVTAQNDALVARFDTAGTYLNHFTIGGETAEPQEFFDIAVNNGDSIYVGGYSKYPGADMDPGAGVSQLYVNTVHKEGVLGVYAPDFSFLYGRRTSSNKGSEFTKIGIDGHGDAYMVLRWNFETQNYDGSVTFEYSPTYQAAVGGHTKVGSERFISGTGYRRGVGINIIKLTRQGTIGWNKSLMGGTTATNELHDLIGLGDYIYVAGVIPNGYFINDTKKDFGTNGGHGYVFRFNASNGNGGVLKYFKTTTTATDYVHSIDTMSGNLMIAGHWNGNSTMDLDPGTASYTLGHTASASFWAELTPALDFQSGGFLASSTGDAGFENVLFKSRGNGSFTLVGNHTDEASFIDGSYGPNVGTSGTTLSKVDLIPNQPPTIATVISDTLIGASEFRMANIETLFTDPEGGELTMSVNEAYTEDYYLRLEPEGLLAISFYNNTKVTVNLTATDPQGASTSQSFTVRYTDPARLAHTYPVDGQQLVPTDASIGFSYNTELDVTSLDGVLSVWSSLRGEIPGEWSYTKDTAVFVPDTTFLAGEQVSVAIQIGVKAESDTVLVAPQVFQFECAVGQGVNELAFATKELAYEALDVTSAKFTDLDGDGDLDIVATSSLGTDLVYLLRGDGHSFGQPVKINDTYQLSDVWLADVNGDGVSDLIANSKGSGVYAFYHDGKLNFTAHQLIDESANALASYVADVNLDGLIDVVRTHMSDKKVYLFTQNADSSFTKTNLAIPFAYTELSDVTVADFTGDGLPDVSVSTKNEVYILSQKSDGSFGYRARALSNYTASQLYPVDIDQDGDMDIAYARTQAYGIGILLNGGNGISFTNKAIGDGDNFDTKTIAAGDVDGDGTIDLVTFAEYTKRVIAHLNDGEMNFTKKHLLTTASSVNSVSLGDSDGDADLDILIGTALDGVQLIENRVIELLPPVLEVSLNTIVLDEDSQLDVTEKLDTLFSDPLGEGLSYTAITSNDSVSVTISGTELTLETSMNFHGSAILYLSATNRIGTTTDTLDIQVTAVNDAPNLVSALDDLSATEDAVNEQVDLSETFADVDGDALELSFEVLAGSENCTIALSDDVLTFGTIADAYGEVEVVIIAKDSQELMATDTILLTIHSVNDAPVFEISTDSIVVGKNFSSTERVIVTGLSPANEADQAISYALQPASVAWANLAIDANTGEVTILAEQDQFGSQLFTITANDGQLEHGTYSMEFYLEVQDNQTPLVVSQPQDVTFLEDAANRTMISDVSVFFSDPEGDALTFEATSSNDTIALVFTGNELSYEAPRDYYGQAQITLIANDGNSAISVTFDLSITSVNDAPEVTNPVADLLATEDVGFSYNLPLDQFTDVDNADLNLAVTGLPAWLTFDGFTRTLFGNPTNDDVGAVTVTITADDGEWSVADEFQITVVNVNDAPELLKSIPNISILEDTPGFEVVDLDSMFRDIDGDVLSYQLINNHTAVNVSIDQNNVITLNALSNKNGNGTIDLSVTDGQETLGFTVAVEVISVNDAPEFTLSKSLIQLEADFTESVLIDLLPAAVPEDEQGEVVTYSISSNDDNVVNASVSGNAIELTAIPGASGSQLITITADDGNGENNLYQEDLEVEIAEVLSLGKATIKLYPNPAQDYLWVTGFSGANYEISDLSGKVILQGGFSSQIDVTGLSPGTYILRLIGGDSSGSLVSRFSKN